MYKLLILVSSFFLVVAKKCDTNKNGNNPCTEVGTLKDFTGLDGCGFLIVMDDGEKLQPVKYADKNIHPKDGQRIKFSYKEITDLAGICMAGKMVEITCIEFLENTTPPKTGGIKPPKTGGIKPPKTGGIKPIKIKCVETLDPYSTEWMQITMRKTNAYQVIRYTYRTDGFAYYFLGPQKQMMFDCQGTLICESSSSESKCDDKTKNYSEELVIWEKD
ncbi:MAG TPA: hypothetical protein ENJ53_08340 [Phaeodactylibacter sp.]|nr:hypothetical protein [Phaeodactylibacter sp.]